MCVVFRGFQGGALKAGLKNNEDHLGLKSGGQIDLHFDNLDVRPHIVKWSLILIVLIDSGLKNDVHHKWRSDRNGEGI